MRDLSRLLAPRSVAVVGGGVWCRNVVQQLQRMGFSGDIWRVHPDATAVFGVVAVPDITDLPRAPDAAFLGVNRHASVKAVRQLAHMGAGGAVCFASGFSEAQAEDADSSSLQNALVDAAGEMPVLGPNCYGFINALEGALLWPDQHGCQPVGRGVAILTQSSNIAINLSMQQRALPVAFVVTCGNMAQTSQAEIATALLDDPRVTAIGLHVEGFGDIPAWHAFAHKAHARGVSVVVLKIGLSDAARDAAVSHTASLSGSHAGANALIARLGMAQVHDVPSLLETLMLLHNAGPLSSPSLSSISCSGGEASLVADMVAPFKLDFPPLTNAQRQSLAAALGHRVALANPLDYHTYIWGDAAGMSAAWAPMADDHIGLVLVIVDFPHTDADAWDCAKIAAIDLHKNTGRPVALVATLPELLPEHVARDLLAAGVTPLHGVREALTAAEAAAHFTPPVPDPPWRVAPDGVPGLISEAQGKAALRAHGVPVPKGHTARRADLQAAARLLSGPLVLKQTGDAHKSETGGVCLNLTADRVADAASQMPGTDFLLEEMVQGTLCELLVGVTRDAAHGYVLTIGAGGVHTELWQDSVSLLLPVTRDDIAGALQQLRIYPVLTGYRGSQKCKLTAILDAVMALQTYVATRKHALYEIEINPLMCTPEGATAADVLAMELVTYAPTGEPDGSD